MSINYNCINSGRLVDIIVKVCPYSEINEIKMLIGSKLIDDNEILYNEMINLLSICLDLNLFSNECNSDLIAYDLKEYIINNPSYDKLLLIKIDLIYSIEQENHYYQSNINLMNQLLDSSKESINNNMNFIKECSYCNRKSNNNNSANTKSNNNYTTSLYTCALCKDKERANKKLTKATDITSNSTANDDIKPNSSNSNRSKFRNRLMNAKDELYFLD